MADRKPFAPVKTKPRHEFEAERLKKLVERFKRDREPERAE